ncbi:MAG: FG-GAP-like repeat-containing protein, partial [Bacteroidota bacterium]
MNKWYLMVGLFGLFSQHAFPQAFEVQTNGRSVLGTYKERTASLSCGDIDGDGDKDIVVANGRHWPGQNRIFINNGSGIFTVERGLGNLRSTTYATELADLDGDGDLDIAVGNDRAPNNIFLNDGTGIFSIGTPFG